MGIDVVHVILLQQIENIGERFKILVDVTALQGIFRPQRIGDAEQEHGEKKADFFHG